MVFLALAAALLALGGGASMVGRFTLDRGWLPIMIVDGLGKYRSEKGRHWHWKARGAQTAVCYAYAPYPTDDVEIAALKLKPCGNCERRRTRQKQGAADQGEKNFDAVIGRKAISLLTKEKLHEYAAKKRATPTLSTSAQP